MRTVRSLLMMAAMGLVAGMGSRAEAGLMVAEYSGALGPTSTLGGVALGAATTSITINATFDTTTGVEVVQGFDYFPVTSFTINVAGYGTFAGIPNSDFNVYLGDPSDGYGYSVGFGTPETASNIFTTPGFDAVFETVTSSFSASAPTPSALSDWDEFGYPGFPYSIQLVGVTGGLVINDYDPNFAITASLSAVPEPSSLALAGTAATIVGLGGLLVRRRRRRIA